MGSEDSLAGIAVRNLVSAILELLDTDDTMAPLPGDDMIELKNLSCNILAHLMDVMPKAADAVVMAIPLLLNTMSCSFVGDILERIINVLEQVSRRHGRQVLLYGGVTVSGHGPSNHPSCRDDVYACVFMLTCFCMHTHREI